MSSVRLRSSWPTRTSEATALQLTSILLLYSVLRPPLQLTRYTLGALQ